MWIEKHVRWGDLFKTMFVGVLLCVMFVIAGCGITNRQMDIAEAYIAASDLQDVEKLFSCSSQETDVSGKSLNAADRSTKIVCDALAVRQAYMKLLSNLTKAKSKGDHPKGYFELIGKLDLYIESLTLRSVEKVEFCWEQNEQEEKIAEKAPIKERYIADAKIVGASRLNFHMKVREWKRRDRDKLLMSAVKYGTLLIGHIDALIGERIKEKFENVSDRGDIANKYREWVADLTMLHFAIKSNLSNRRSCRNTSRSECGSLYNEIDNVSANAPTPRSIKIPSWIVSYRIDTGWCP